MEKYLYCWILLLAFVSSAQAKVLTASVYWEDKYVASGARFHPDGLSVAHKTLKLGTLLTISYKRKKIVCPVLDRGPFVRGRDIDLSRGAARALHFPGLGKVNVEPYPPLPRARPN